MVEVNKIYCGNCIEVMSDIPTGSIPLTVTSPPYDDLRIYQGYTFEFERIAKELYRITKQSGVVVWIVGDQTIDGNETGTSFRQALYFKEIGFNLHDTMIYEKLNYKPINAKRYDNVFEYMFIFVRGKIKTFNPILVKTKRQRLETSKFRSKDGELHKKQYFGSNVKKKTNVWKYAVGVQIADKIAFKHPAIFPEQLVNDHILSWSNKGDIVLDPMCGSGTTCKIAKKLDRKYIGIDISEEYC